jgi:hypothetical protein
MFFYFVLLLFFFFFFSFQVFDIAKMTINHKKDLSRFRHKQEIKKIEIPNMNIPYLWEPTIQDWHDFIFIFIFSKSGNFKPFKQQIIGRSLFYFILF